MNWFLRILLTTMFAAHGIVTSGAELTEDQLKVVRDQIEDLRTSLDSNLSKRNRGAAETFLSAAQDPKAAVSLYLKCHEEIDFKREEKRDSEFREWRDNNADRIGSDGFVMSLCLQLQYLGLSCKAAEMESIADVFTPLMSYVESLSQISERPTTEELLRSSSNSIFAEAYNLKDLLGKNEHWEPVPFNVAGIYERCIFPFLRANKPEGLMNAWDKRIEQQTRLAGTLNELMDEREREITLMPDGKQKKDAWDKHNRYINSDSSRMLRSSDKDDFVRETLPRLKWEKLKDKFRYVDQVGGAKEMLDFVNAHLSHELAEDFFRELESLLGDIDGDSGSDPVPASN